MKQVIDNWIAVRSFSGEDGEYQVEKGWMTVRRKNGRTKGARASSVGLPGSLSIGADATLAKVILSERW